MLIDLYWEEKGKEEVHRHEASVLHLQDPDERAAAARLARMTPARADEHVPIHYVRCTGGLSGRQPGAIFHP